MPALSTDKAIERLTRKIEDEFDPDELLEVYNKLFEDDAYTSQSGSRGPISNRRAASRPFERRLRSRRYIANVESSLSRSTGTLGMTKKRGTYHYNERKPQTVD